MVEKLFFGYCTLISVFLSVTGAFLLLQTGNPLFFIILLPITGYFTYYLLRAIFNKTPIPTNVSTRNTFVVIICSLIILSSFSFYKIQSSAHQKKPISTWQKMLPTKIIPTPIPNYVEIDTEKAGDSWVNLRKNPSTLSKVIGKAMGGKKYTVISTSINWVEIQLDASTSAWINTS